MAEPTELDNMNRLRVEAANKAHQLREALRELVDANQELANYHASDGIAEYRKRRERERAAWVQARDLAFGVETSEGGQKNG